MIRASDLSFLVDVEAAGLGNAESIESLESLESMTCLSGIGVTSGTLLDLVAWSMGVTGVREHEEEATEGPLEEDCGILAGIRNDVMSGVRLRSMLTAFSKAEEDGMC